MPEYLRALLIFAAVITLAAGWVLLLLWLLARFGGWSKLAQCHPADHRPEGKTYHWRSLQIGPLMGYNNCLSVVLSREGAYIAPSFIVRFAHPPLLIPWNRIGSMHESRFLFLKWHCLPIYAAGLRFKLFLPASAREWIERDLAQ